MDNREMALLVLAMAAVTYIPRAIPAVLLERLRLGPRGEKFLKLIPYTAMAALIWPGVLSVDSQRPAVGVLGAAVAALLAWRRCPLLLCVVSAIAAAALSSWAL